MATLVFTPGCYSAHKPPLSASSADPWSALTVLEPGNKVSVWIDKGLIGGHTVGLRGRFVSFDATQLSITVDTNRFSQPPRTGSSTLFVRSEGRPSRRRPPEIELAVAGAMVRGRQVEISLHKEAISSVSKPSIYRWAGPLLDCTHVGLVGSGAGALSGWAAGNTENGTLIGAAIGCALGVMFWYGDRSDTAGLEWDSVYRRPRTR